MYRHFVERCISQDELFGLLQDPDVSIPLACEDFAMTRIWQGYVQIKQEYPYYPDYPCHTEIDLIGMFEQRKVARWREFQIGLAERLTPRTIEMQLYPVYFALIQGGRKSVEGRAFNPDSTKDYPNVRRGDQIKFTVSREIDTWEEDCNRLGIVPDSVMIGTIRRVRFGPLVQAVFHNHKISAGELFQPILRHIADPVSTSIIRAARYYEIPGYPELIRTHG
ncbi:MAG: hypothetical protein U9Q67_02410, partial [Patescibacteria group bacterium]|nr:hypothetical protein [Patescibacteria group bacterium]